MLNTLENLDYVTKIPTPEEIAGAMPKELWNEFVSVKKKAEEIIAKRLERSGDGEGSNLNLEEEDSILRRYKELINEAIKELRK